MCCYLGNPCAATVFFFLSSKKLGFFFSQKLHDVVWKEEGPMHNVMERLSSPKGFQLNLGLYSFLDVLGVDINFISAMEKAHETYVSTFSLCW